MELRFGKDYHENFDTKAYLNDYFSGISENDGLSEFPARGFHEFWSKMTEKDLKILDFGAGPKISDLISAAPYAEEIIFAEYSEKNRQAAEKWLQKSPDSHDWSSYFRFIVQRLEGGTSEEASIRESELRKKISHVLPCDIEWEDPVKWPSTWSSQAATFDVVTTSLCLEACVTSREGYRNAIAKLKRYLKPGGYVVMFGVLEETYYMVGQEKFYCFPLSKNLIEETLAIEGFKMPDNIKLLPVNLEPHCDAKEMFFLSAVLQDD